MDRLLRKNSKLMNEMAFSYLIEYGKKNILDDRFFTEQLKLEEEKEKGIVGLIITPEVKKEIMEIARYMAEMKDKDLKKYVYNEVKAERKMQKER